MLFESYSLRDIHLNNRLVMSPLTRSRAVDNNTPNELMAAYYAQRASAGLIITEGTSPSPNGLGYARSQVCSMRLRCKAGNSLRMQSMPRAARSSCS